MSFIRDDRIPMSIISISSLVNGELICIENMFNINPKITQKTIDYIIEILIAPCNRSNFFAP